MDRLSCFSDLIESSHQGSRVEHRFQRLVVRTAVKMLRHSPYVTDWYPKLDDPLMLRILRMHPRICEKISRPYLRYGLSYAQRHRYLIGHYHWLRTHLSDQALIAIYMGEGLPLLHTFLGDAGEYRLLLHYLDQFEMEGDMTLSLVRSDGIRIYSITFTMLEMGHDVFVQIGGIQGGAELNGTIKQLTKALHGMRPKVLVLNMLMQLIHVWGCVRLFGVGNDNHVYRGLSFNRGRKGRIRTDYDGLWRDAGGRIAPDNAQLYELPLAWPHKSIEVVPTQKRAMYRRRYAMLESLTVEVEAEARRALQNEA